MAEIFSFISEETTNSFLGPLATMLIDNLALTREFVLHLSTMNFGEALVEISEMFSRSSLKLIENPLASLSLYLLVCLGVGTIRFGVQRMGKIWKRFCEDYSDIDTRQISWFRKMTEKIALWSSLGASIALGVTFESFNVAISPLLTIIELLNTMLNKLSGATLGIINAFGDHLVNQVEARKGGNSFVGLAVNTL
jgi:hypothetical protein